MPLMDPPPPPTLEELQRQKVEFETLIEEGDKILEDPKTKEPEKEILRGTLRGLENSVSEVQVAILDCEDDGKA